MNIDIPLDNQWRAAMLNGRKTCTSRTKAYGAEGGTFGAFGGEFILTEVRELTLETVCFEHYLEEGCHSPLEFRNVWIKLHPRVGFVPEQVVHCHWFSRIVQEREIRPSNSPLAQRWIEGSIPRWREILKESEEQGDTKRADYARWMLTKLLKAEE